MGTRGAIARLTDKGKGFQGRYHHWDSYPTGLGKTLFNLYNSYFDRNLEFMLKTLIDDHPAGWSTINDKNFMVKAGFNEYKPTKSRCGACGTNYVIRAVPDFCSECGVRLKEPAREEDNRPNCYCHGDRKEEGWLVDEKNASGSGVEYAYVFNVKTGHMYIMSSYTDIGSPNGEKDQKMVGFFGAGDENAVWKPIGEVDLDGEEPNWEAIGN